MSITLIVWESLKLCADNNKQCFFCEPFLMFEQFECCSIYQKLVESLAKRKRENVYGLFIVDCWLFVVGCWLLVVSC